MQLKSSGTYFILRNYPMKILVHRITKIRIKSNNTTFCNIYFNLSILIVMCQYLQNSSKPQIFDFLSLKMALKLSVNSLPGTFNSFK